MGVKISKRYNSYKLQPKVFKLLLILLPKIDTELSWGFLKFLVSDFERFFFQNFKLTIGWYGKNKKKPLIIGISDRRVKQREMWDSVAVLKHIYGVTFDLVIFKSF